jgi:hypothetical protein
MHKFRGQSVGIFVSDLGAACPPSCGITSEVEGVLPPPAGADSDCIVHLPFVLPTTLIAGLLWELPALRLGLLQDGDVGVGALGKEILINSQRPR